MCISSAGAGKDRHSWARWAFLLWFKVQKPPFFKKLRILSAEQDKCFFWYSGLSFEAHHYHDTVPALGGVWQGMRKFVALQRTLMQNKSFILDSSYAWYLARILDGVIKVSFIFSNISGKPLAEAGREIGYGSSFIEWFRCFHPWNFTSQMWTSRTP